MLIKKTCNTALLFCTCSHNRTTQAYGMVASNELTFNHFIQT